MKSVNRKRTLTRRAARTLAEAERAKVIASSRACERASRCEAINHKLSADVALSLVEVSFGQSKEKHGRATTLNSEPHGRVVTSATSTPRCVGFLECLWETCAR